MWVFVFSQEGEDFRDGVIWFWVFGGWGVYGRNRAEKVTVWGAHVNYKWYI